MSPKVALPRFLLCGIALFADLAVVPASRGDSIIYELHAQLWPHNDVAFMVVDGAALDRGFFTNDDIEAFAFPPLFTAGGLAPLSFAIGPDGVPLGGGGLGEGLFGERVVDGTTCRMEIQFGERAFSPYPGAFYQVEGGGTPGIYGAGYWTATLEAVPGPSSLVLSGFGGLWLFFVRFLRLRRRA